MAVKVLSKDKKKEEEKFEFVEELIAGMSIDEKVAQMVQVPVAMVSMEEARKWAARGAGSFLHVLGDDARELQSIATSTRLGIPVLFGIDAIHGHGLNDNATIFPSQLAMACSWNKDMVRKIGRAVAEEVASDGLHWTFSPVLCIARDTRWGRVNETFGEDPYLIGELGEAIIQGYQGDDLSSDTSILACAKHYIGYGEAVGGRDACDTEMTYRKMREVFLPPFEKAARAGCATFMTAYGSIDGMPFTVDRKTLHDILRDEAGFEGFLVTDWDNVNSLIVKQHVCDDISDASRLAAEAGNDMIMTTTGFYDAAVELVKSGKLSESVIDEAVRHILNVKYRMGLFEKPEKTVSADRIGCAEHLETSIEAARETVVVARNNGILPIDRSKVKKIAVVGPNADDVRAQYGDWTYFTHPIPGLYREPKRPYKTLIEGMRDLAQDAEIVYAKGCSVTTEDYYESFYDALGNGPQVDIDANYYAKIYAGNDRSMDRSGEDRVLDEAVSISQDADIIVYAIGDNYDQAGEYKDRADLSLSGRQDELFERLKATGKPIVTVLISTKPLAAVKEVEESDAFVVAFNGGMFAGQAIAEVIYGETEPVGRLPISFPVHSGQLPVYYNYLAGWHGDRHVDIPREPLLSFGEGLGYSKSEYSNLTFDVDKLTVAVDVKNVGDRPLTETVQIYVNDMVSSVMTPVKQLVGFKRVSLAAGETATVSVELDEEAFSVVLPNEQRVIEEGEFEIMAGHSSKDEDLLKMKVYMSV